jgi:hypothetical protein
VAVLTRDEAKKKARSFLLRVSNDDSWIDASDEWVRNELASLLMSVAQSDTTMREECDSNRPKVDCKP